MGVFDFFRRGALRLILRNALALEEEIYAHFLDLPEELAGLELPPALQKIVEEEREHRHLLEQMIAGRLEGRDLEKALEARHVHNLEQVQPLEARYEPIVEKLRHIAGHERAVYEFFRSLYEKSKIPFVKRAFHFLTQQEEVHVRLLERLLGGG
jgi:rubrerythrin